MWRQGARTSPLNKLKNTSKPAVPVREFAFDSLVPMNKTTVSMTNPAGWKVNLYGLMTNPRGWITNLDWWTTNMHGWTINLYRWMINLCRWMTNPAGSITGAKHFNNIEHE